MDRRDFVRNISVATLAGALFGCASQGENKTADTGGMKFSANERALITSFFEQQRGRGPAKAAPAQMAMVGGKLPSGARPAKLPTDLDAKLPGLPDPYTRLTLGADVILVNRNTHDIADVIPQIAY